MDTAVPHAVRLVKRHFALHDVPKEHGTRHAITVMNHATLALQWAKDPPSAGHAVAVRLAALLHDVDDRKYFPAPDGDQKSLPHADAILREVLVCREDADKVREYALAAIRLVSASGNGNTVPPEAAADPFLLYPRWADRLEAVGDMGVYRCWKYTLEKGRPLYCADTPTPRNADEAFALATPGRFAAYQVTGKSKSMIDHYFDKLLCLFEPLAHHQNRYIAEKGAAGVAPLIAVCTATRPEGLEFCLDEIKARVKASP